MPLDDLIYEKEAALARAEGAERDWDQAREADDQIKVAAPKQAMSDALEQYEEHNKRIVEIRANIRERADSEVTPWR